MGQYGVEGKEGRSVLSHALNQRPRLLIQGPCHPQLLFRPLWGTALCQPAVLEIYTCFLSLGVPSFLATKLASCALRLWLLNSKLSDSSSPPRAGLERIQIWTPLSRLSSYQRFGSAHLLLLSAFYLWKGYTSCIHFWHHFHIAKWAVHAPSPSPLQERFYFSSFKI